MASLMAVGSCVASVARCIPLRGDATLATPTHPLRPFQMQRLQRQQRWPEIGQAPLLKQPKYSAKGRF
jgi:hypothetical protein